MAWCLGIEATFEEVVVTRVIVRLGRSGGLERRSYWREMRGDGHRAGTHIETWLGLWSLKGRGMKWRYCGETQRKVLVFVGPICIVP